MISLVADVAALHWTGMWQALTARNPQRAVMGSIARILVLPWLGMALALLIIVLSPPPSASTSQANQARRPVAGPGNHDRHRLWRLGAPQILHRVPPFRLTTIHPSARSLEQAGGCFIEPERTPSKRN